jgi:intein-encoded DNA endonuclease-like protein
MKLLISEVIKKTSNAKTKAEKIKILRDNNTQALRSILKWNFDPAIQTDLPEGEVPFNKNDSPIGTEHTVLERESKGLWRFIKGANTLNKFKREQLFIQLLEGLHESEAEIVILTKDKQLHNKYRITQAVVKEAFPEIQWSDAK